ncbi:hypothetical protein I302_106301 [Kwoniella bestiolae CBS 10118]|uniref:Uncharacterized protein n=1 Tax=Kwoniella bestiolae CBS 10118 TaxID=1296100 RepID=A0A1B9G3J7_9TREE|nr:hypothetical protein I302_05425 [Kwoniella bestiolae CBS 10118]OCF25605.1 hypothetical protein I302_05425 [Kwoniella bestiolae CBS 10118]
MDKKDRDRHAAERSYAECQEELAELKVDYKELQEELEWKEGIEIELKEVKEELRSREQREEERRDMITVLGASGFDRSFLEEHAPTPPSVTNDNNKRVNEVRNLNQEVEGSRRRVVALEGRIQGQEEELVKMRLKHSKTNEKLGQVVMEKDGLLKELEILKRRLVEQEQGKEATLSISGNVMGKSKESREKEVIDLCED